MGEFFGFTIYVSNRRAPLRWSPSPLLYASAAVHLGAAAAVLARPRTWPWALGALAANHVALATAGLSIAESEVMAPLKIFASSGFCSKYLNMGWP